MSSIGLRGRKGCPSHHTTPPIPLSLIFGLHKMIVYHGFMAFVIASLMAPIISNARFGAQSSTGNTQNFLLVVIHVPVVQLLDLRFLLFLGQELIGVGWWCIIQDTMNTTVLSIHHSGVVACCALVVVAAVSWRQASGMSMKAHHGSNRMIAAPYSFPTRCQNPSTMNTALCLNSYR